MIFVGILDTNVRWKCLVDISILKEWHITFNNIAGSVKNVLDKK